MKYKNLEEFKKELKKLTSNICSVDDDEIINYYYNSILESCEDYHNLKLNELKDISDKFQKFEDDMIQIDPEFVSIVNENFWDLVETSKETNDENEIIGYIDWIEDEHDKTGWVKSEIYDEDNEIIDESKYEIKEVLERDKYEHIIKAKFIKL